MKNTKIVKAYCPVGDRHFGLEVKNIGGVWKVVDFITMTKEEASVVNSQVEQSSFYTNDSLLACNKCGNRKVAGCNCASSNYNCRASRNYNFQCIYCKNLKLDYSTATATQGLKEGDVIYLSQGQEIKISYPNKTPLKTIKVGVGWDPTVFGQDIDVDSSVIVAGPNDCETVCYYNLDHSSGCVRHFGDDLTGRHTSGQDDEKIDIYLDKVPTIDNKLYFIINIYKSSIRQQTLGQIKNLFIRLYDQNNKPLVQYNVEKNFDKCTAIVIGMASRNGNGWKFKAIGEGNTCSSISQLEDYCLNKY